MSYNFDTEFSINFDVKIGFAFRFFGRFSMSTFFVY